MDKIEEAAIRCLTFQKQEAVIRHLPDRINRSTDVKTKARLAEVLQKEAQVLLSCPDYNNEKLECRSCRFIQNMRKRTATLIIKNSRYCRAAHEET